MDLGPTPCLGEARVLPRAAGEPSWPISSGTWRKVKIFVCVDPGANDDLQARRIYRALPDASAARSRYIRVVDDSGEDYLYPERLFLPVQLSLAAREALSELSAAGV